ncbi:hypothetical protein BofuT4_uP080460.1 [Botrytis cinerea T4]|uniref:Uncharacterized protein n=1 Tax=Botryotinia fuckeliana (strain T4) TaxID=999810 RepID=G2YKV3_BOTF4|nr:hypothetical protein BofuT4_uP080460.1 [Botrytis cinerea T4]
MTVGDWSLDCATNKVLMIVVQISVSTSALHPLASRRAPSATTSPQYLSLIRFSQIPEDIKEPITFRSQSSGPFARDRNS